MYAIVEIAGHQFKVEKDQRVFVNRLSTEEGKKVSFDNVLLIEEGYRVKNGHRQSLTEIVIESIATSGARKATKVENEEAKKAAPKKEVKKAEPKVEAKAAAPKAKKAAPTKAAAKKATGKADDLKKIEGIGPKIASTLVEAGIATYADLAKAKPAAISEIIAGVRGNHVTDTWPAQAKLAADGKWDELKKWQDELDGGKA